MKKSTLRTCLIILAVCLGISLGYVLLNRTTSRDATAEEIAAHQVYAVDWKSAPGWEEGMSEKEFLLNLSSFQEEKEIGSNVHQVYSSDAMAGYLYRCRELSEITVMNGTLYITYYCEDEDMVILKKYQPCCIFCGDGSDISMFRGKKVCRKCIAELTEK